MSAGPSLYRRHRPRTFADVVGQEHVVRTLSHAVERDQVHHAYLFVGSRGTGKTSMAKILAASLNCDSGPTVSPCGSCDSCLSIASATSLDVIEMDAASNNSVDDIRALRETVAYAPVSGKHKVYILDEAHMLSTQAWNAFLKTLEEPPSRTVFVLATTEANKVLPTVVDRCHRFDFGRPAAEQVQTVIKRVVAKEEIAIADGAVALIARHATGSYRDALGTLEQLVTYVGSETIQPQDVLDVLGIADAEQLFGAVDAIVAGDAPAALRAAATLAASGRDPGQVLRDLETHARELLTVQIIGAVPPELRVTSDHDMLLAEQARSLGETDAVRLLELVAGAIDAASNGAQPRIQLELVLIKAAAPEMDPSTSALLSRIERLEKGARRPAAASVPQPVDLMAVPDPDDSGGSEGEGLQRRQLADPPQPDTAAGPGVPVQAHDNVADLPVPAPPVIEFAPEPAPASKAEPGSDSRTEPGSEFRTEPGSEPPAAVPAHAGDFEDVYEPYEPDASEPRPHETATNESGDRKPDAVEPGARKPDAVEPGARETGVGEPGSFDSGDRETGVGEPGTYEPDAVELDLAQLTKIWPAVVEMVKSANGMLGGMIAPARPLAVNASELVLAFPPDAEFQRRKCEQDEHRRATQEALKNVTGVTLAIRYEIAGETPEDAVPDDPEPPKPMTEDELVGRLVDEFGAKEISDQDQENQ